MPKIFFILLLCIVAINVYGSSLSDTILGQNPTAYWRFGETSGTTAIDSTGNGYNGTYTGSYSLNASGAGLDGDTALRVTSGYMTVSVPSTPSFTCIVWGKSATSTWNQHGWLASARYANGFIIHPSAGSQSVPMYIISNASGDSYTGLSSVTPADITQWHQYGISYDYSSKEVKIIQDGQVAYRDTYTGTRTNSNITIWFGQDQCEGTRYGNGWVDEASFFNRQLSDSEILAQYNAVVTIPEASSLLSLSCFVLFLLWKSRK